MGKYIVLSPIKSGGKLREIGETVELEEAHAAALRPGIVEAVKTKAAAGASDASSAAGASAAQAPGAPGDVQSADGAAAITFGAPTAIAAEAKPAAKATAGKTSGGKRK